MCYVLYYIIHGAAFSCVMSCVNLHVNLREYLNFKYYVSEKCNIYRFILFSDGRGLSTNVLIYIIVGCSIVFTTGIMVVVVVMCCKRNPNSPDRKKGYALTRAAPLIIRH